MDKYIEHTDLTMCDNTCINIGLTDYAIKELSALTTSDLDWSGSYSGEGIEFGQISSQYPDSPESQLYIAGLYEEEFNKIEFESEENKDKFFELVGNIIEAGLDMVSRKDYEQKRVFGTSDLIEHDALVEHGYYNNTNLVLLEDPEEEEFYVTFTTNPRGTIYLDEYKTFDSLEAAKDYIKSNKDDDETWQDFNISHRIWKDLTNED